MDEFTTLLANAVGDMIVITDADGLILSCNTAWTHAALERGASVDGCGVGRSYLAVCDPAIADGDDVAVEAHRALCAVLGGTASEARVRYPCVGPEGVDWYDMAVHAAPHPGRFVITHRVVTDVVAAQSERDRTERRYRALVEQSPEAVCIIDAGGTVLHASPGVERLLGRPASSLVGKDSALWLHPDDLAMQAAKLARDAQSEGPGDPVVLRMLHADGSWRWVEAIPTNLLGDPDVGGIVVNSRDITERVVAERHAAAQHAVLSLVAQNATIVELIESLGSGIETDLPGADCVITLDPPAAHDQAWTTMPIDGHDSPVAWMTCRTACLERATDAQLERLAAWRSLAGVVMQRSVDVRNLEYAAHHDALTALPNRRCFADACSAALERTKREGGSLLVAVLDLDRFKSVNDTLGHAVGDDLLIDVASRLTRVIRRGDTVIRLGGDEFAICAGGLDDLEAASFLANVLAAARSEVDIHAAALSVQASIGYVLAKPDDQRDIGDLLRDADVAMYEAKARGRAQAVRFDDQLRRRVSERVRLEAALARAISGDELRLDYQPIVDLRSGRRVAFEALVRWHHNGSIVMPSEFIPVAEESGLIRPLGAWVLNEAARTAAGLRAVHDSEAPVIAVNISARQLVDEDFEASVAETLVAHGLPAAALCLEITETALIETDRAVAALHRLRAAGHPIHLDDFGTGYSSLAYLRQLPLDAIKLDRQFISLLGTDADATAVTSAIIALASSLHLDVIAEGIETEAQRDALTSIGCTTGQGWLLGRPAPMTMAERTSTTRPGSATDPTTRESRLSTA